MNHDLEQNLRTHLQELCKAPRSPHSPGYVAAQEYLKGVLRSLGCEPQSHYFYPLGFGRCENIYGLFGDARAGKRILIGAHYETRPDSGVGADDNASAVAVAIEAIRLLKEKTSKPLTLMFFDMEENFGLSSLRGSRAFAREFYQEYDSVVVLDLVGGTLAPGFEKVYMQFGPALSKVNHPQIETLHLPMRVMEPIGSIGARSDYDEFRQLGVPHAFFSSGTPWYYHTHHDDLSQMNYGKMAALTEGIVDAVLQRISSAPTIKEVSWSDFPRFLELLNNVSVLKSPVIESMMQSKEGPSRLQIIRLYMHVLPILRKWGARAWSSAA